MAKSRVCGGCGKRKPLSGFSKYYQQCSAFLARCRSCVSEKNRQDRYGISSDEYERLAEGGCSICGINYRLCVDHCHATGIVRGVICYKCNTAIGLLGDDEEGIEKALKYLRSAYLDL